MFDNRISKNDASLHCPKLPCTALTTDLYSYHFNIFYKLFTL